jgi:queuosine biosynthesis protein QueC
MRYTVTSTPTIPAGAGRVLQIGANLKNGESDFRRDFGSVSSLELDLLNLASAVFAADRGAPRGEREDYSRELELTVPVVNAARLLPLLPQVEAILRFLSDDVWTIHLPQKAGEPEEQFTLGEPQSRTLLFSGGLDSFAAAVEFGRGPTPLQLVSHRTRNQVTDTAQRLLMQQLAGGGYNVQHHQYFVSSTDGGPTPFDHDAENSQRTRSFMFLVLGGLVARRTGGFEIMYLAENGQMAIHLPLTVARIGAFSTHTAHPTVVMEMERFLREALQAPVRIENPYLYRTKREVAEVVTNGLPGAVAETTSCWRNARLPVGIGHCGDCIPCQIRRIALEFTGTDPTRYARNLWVEPIGQLGPDDTGRRNVVELTEFIYRFRTESDESLLSAFPELLSEDFDGVAALGMYRRFAGEAHTVLARYPALGELLA